MIAVVLFNLYAWLLCFSLPACLAVDTLNAGQKITGIDSTLVSTGGKFELGFFSKDGSGRYLGIWYHRQDESETQTVVWVANRDSPVASGSTGVFQIAEDGNLVVVDTSGTKKPYWSSKLKGSSSSSSSSSSSRNRTVKLMDSGNLVLLDEMKVKLWESFEHPTDTILLGMKMDRNMKLTSWRSQQDPGSGSFIFKMDQTGDNNVRFTILNKGQLHWESEEHDETLNLESAAKSSDDDISTEVYNLLTNFTNLPTNFTNLALIRNNNTALMTYYDNTRLVLNSTGVIQFVLRDKDNNLDLGGVAEIVRWLQPRSKCLIYSYCGNFASCNDNDKDVCKCLPGFNDELKEGEGNNAAAPSNSLQDKALRFQCTRRKPAITCGKDTTTFLNLTMVKIGAPNQRIMAEDEPDCRSKCLQMCPQCQAYSYATTTQRLLNPSTCWIWTNNLTTFKEEYTVYTDGDGRNISVLIDKSDIAPTPRTCEPCGTNVVPYPLSTGPSCGELAYSNFSCNISTGELSFLTSATSYRVIRVDPGYRKFLVRNHEADSFNRYCEKSQSLKVSPPFTNTDNSCSDQLEVSWQPPFESPTCVNSTDCDGWEHSSCKGNRCLCDANYHWHGDRLSCTTEKALSYPPNATNLEEPTRKGNSKSSSLSLILGLTLTGVVVVAWMIIFAYVCRRKIAHKLKQEGESIQRNRGRFYDSERHVKDLIDMEGLEENDNEGIEVPYFDFESILVATDHFSDANKLGKGGYGPVYKGKLQGGQDIAVKRLSSVSSQGLQEFKNEVVLIAKLQHRNLVRLRGYCVKGDEKILLYEYMPNKSLDSFLFDPTKSVLLDWQMRFDIIIGIARGMLYLHQDSRLRVIHRDLKTSNILLDADIQPKISDFGLARIFGGKETEANTERVVGTYGYMSPEYALDGQFSTKSDVFSFGVVLLEIIGGKKNTGFYRSKEISSLLGYAWRLWTEDKLPDLMDISLRETCNANQSIRCAHVALLCVQDEPNDRPTMSNVVIMLDSETATLPTPKQPTFFTRKDLSSTASSSLQVESSIQEGR